MTTLALPLMHINHVSAALSLAALRERAAGSSSHASSPAAHQFFFQSPHQFLGRLADVAHLKSLLSVLKQWMRLYLQARTNHWEVTTNCRGKN